MLSPPQLVIVGRVAVLFQLPFGAYMAYLALQEHGQAGSTSTADPTADPAGIMEAAPMASLCHVALWWFSTALQISLYNGFGGMWHSAACPSLTFQ